MSSFLKIYVPHSQICVIEIKVESRLKSGTIKKNISRIGGRLCFFILFSRGNAGGGGRYRGNRKGCVDRYTSAACIHYSSRVMRPTFIGRLAATPRSPRGSELFAGPSRSLVSLFQFGPRLLRQPSLSSPFSISFSLYLRSRRRRFHPGGLFRFLAFLGSAREIYKAGLQEFPVPRREKRIV